MMSGWVMIHVWIFCFVVCLVYLIKHRKYAHTHTFYGKQEKKQNKDKHHQTVQIEIDDLKWFWNDKNWVSEWMQKKFNQPNLTTWIGKKIVW